MPYNPNIHHRRSIRLKGYDYSQEGLYFITICCDNRASLFGKIENHEMILNDAGKIANECWLEIPQHFLNVILHEHIIMPNHIHGIIEIGTKNVSLSQPIIDNVEETKNVSPLFKSPSRTIGSIVRGYKIGVTKWFRNNTDIQKVWQRDYYEHIIRDEKAYFNISNYIINNPAAWNDDSLKKKS